MGLYGRDVASLPCWLVPDAIRRHELHQYVRGRGSRCRPGVNTNLGAGSIGVRGHDDIAPTDCAVGYYSTAVGSPIASTCTRTYRLSAANAS